MLTNFMQNQHEIVHCLFMSVLKPAGYIFLYCLQGRQINGRTDRKWSWKIWKSVQLGEIAALISDDDSHFSVSFREKALQITCISNIWFLNMVFTLHHVLIVDICEYTCIEMHGIPQQISIASYCSSNRPATLCSGHKLVQSASTARPCPCHR